jgi:N-acetyl-anhydromuramyl-L-alanine amidase AmpD
MTKVQKIKNFKPSGVNEIKTQIILTHTSRKIETYLLSLENRYNGCYDKIPNYIITKQGEILNLLSDFEYSNFLSKFNLNKNSIIVCLENLGWLNKEPLKDYYVNWIGDIYKGKVFERKWRDYHFWDPYTEIQLQKVYELCKELTKKMKIDFVFVGHNTKINGAEKIKGIITRSNLSINSTDLSPAFNFEVLTEKIENVQ